MPRKRDDDVTRSVAAAYVAERGNLSAAARRLDMDRDVARGHLRTELGQQVLADLAGELLDQYRVSAMRVVGEAAAIAFADLPRILREARTVEELAELDAHLRAAISELVIGEDGNIEKVRLHPKLPALQLLAQYADIAGLGSGAADDPASARPELGGLTIVGPGGNTDDQSRRAAIPVPQKLD